VTKRGGEFKDTEEVIRSHKSKKDKQYTMVKRKRTNNDLQKLHRKLKIEQHNPHKKLGVNPGAPEW